MNLRELIRRAKDLRRRADGNELRLAKLLSALYDRSQHIAQDFDRIGVQYRKGMYLISIYRKFVVRWKVPMRRLQRIGWVRLGAIGPVTNGDDRAVIQRWLRTAERTPVSQLRFLVADREPELTNMAFNLTPTQRKKVMAALSEFGMVRNKTRYEGRDAAFMNMVRFALRNVP